MTLLIDDALILTMDAQRRILDPGHLVIEGRRIKTVGPGRFTGDRRGLDVYEAARQAAERGRRLVDAYRGEVATIRRLHPELGAMLRRAYARPTAALAARWHG